MISHQRYAASAPHPVCYLAPRVASTATATPATAPAAIPWILSAATNFFAATVLIAALLLALLYVNQRSLIYFPFGEPPVPAKKLQDDFPGLDDLSLITADNVKLQAYAWPLAPEREAKQIGVPEKLAGSVGKVAEKAPFRHVTLLMFHGKGEVGV